MSDKFRLSRGGETLVAGTRRGFRVVCTGGDKLYWGSGIIDSPESARLSYRCALSGHHAMHFVGFRLVHGETT
jgi:hypothetical protein